MPWEVKKGQGCGSSKPYAVVKVGGGRVACHETREKALAQVRALYASEPTGTGSNLSRTTSEVIMDSVTTTASNGALSTFQFSAPVTITVTTSTGDQVTELDQDPGQGEWESVLAVEGSPSSDKRYLIPSEIGERDLPLPLRVVTSDEGGHDNAVQVGRIESVEHIPLSDFTRAEDFNLGDLHENAIIIYGQGVFDGPEDTVELAKTMIRNGAGVSLDLPHDRLALIDPDTFEEVDESEIELVDVLSGKYLTGIAGKMAAATIVDIPAFEQASVRLREGEAVVASAFGIRLREALVASVGLAPLAPSKDWFEVPEADGPTPLTVTDDGQVYGHLATWDQCHGGFASTCELAPRSKSGYKYFHLGSIMTAEGDQIPVGRITVDKGGSIGGHLWDMYAGTQKAIEHYDRTGSVAAFVRAHDGKYGIWVCGATKSDATPEAIRDMRANPPSGDWRWENGSMEMIAALAVPVPGFPVPYMVASSGDQPVAMIAMGYTEDDKRPLTRSELRKLTSLVNQGREALQMDNMQDVPTEQTCPACDATMPMDATTCPMCGLDMEDMEAMDMAMKKKNSGGGGGGSAACADETPDEVEEKENVPVAV